MPEADKHDRLCIESESPSKKKKRKKKTFFPTNQTRCFRCKAKSKTKQSAPPLPKRIDNKSAHKQSHRDPDCDLNHAIRDIEDVAVDVDA